MKYRINIEQQTYEVEITDLSARPIVVFVDGERFEVNVEADTLAVEAPPIVQSSRHVIAPPRPSNGAVPDVAMVVYAPIPGLIESVAVKVGDTVQSGDTLCVLEAMKMRNIIRSNRAGTISAVYVSAGQQVKHHEPLVRFG